jgi:hypothetical protein
MSKCFSRQVHVYDLLESMLEPILVGNVSEQERVTSIAFNKSDPSLLAASTQSGMLVVAFTGYVFY